jgi:hypothetical protein
MQDSDAIGESCQSLQMLAYCIKLYKTPLKKALNQMV